MIFIEDDTHFVSSTMNLYLLTCLGAHFGEEDVDAGGHAVQGFPRRVLDVSQLLPRLAVRGGAGLHVPAAAVPHPLPHPQPYLRLRL